MRPFFFFFFFSQLCFPHNQILRLQVLDVMNDVLSHRLDDIHDGIVSYLTNILRPELKILSNLEMHMQNTVTSSVKETMNKSKGLIEKIKHLHNKVTDLSETLSDWESALEETKERIGERQKEINEVSVLKDARNSIQKLRVEIKNMNIRIGYLRGVLMKYRSVQNDDVFHDADSEIDDDDGDGDDTANSSSVR